MDKLTVEVRLSRPGDRTVVETLDEICFPYRPWDYMEWESVWGRRGKVVLVAVLARKIVGFLVYEWDARESQLVRIAVQPEQQRQGVGRQLVRSWITRLTTRSSRRLLASVPEGWADIRQFLVACGLDEERLDGGLALYSPPLQSEAKPVKGAVPITLKQRLSMFPGCNYGGLE